MGQATFARQRLQIINRDKFMKAKQIGVYTDAC